MGGSRAAVKCAKVLLVLCNSVLLLLGCILIGAGVYLLRDEAFFSSLKRELPTAMLSICIGTIACGGAVSLIAFVACAGAVTHNRCLLLTYTALASLLVFASVGIVLAAYVGIDSRFGIEKKLILGLRDAYKNNKSATIVVDLMQKSLHCCDWSRDAGSSLHMHKGRVRYPGSCCPPQHSRHCSKAYSFDSTCRETFVMAALVANTSGAAAALICVFLAVCIICSEKKRGLRVV